MVGGVLSYLVARRLTRPLNTLTATMYEIQGGASEKKCPLDPLGFEINTLAETFNSMLTTLLEKKKIAEEERVQLEIYKKELLLGEEVQKRLYLEKKVVCPGVDVTTRYLPAKEVGGDFCDLFLDGNNLVLMIADASGKGVEACFYSLLVRSMLRIFSREFDDVAKLSNKQMSFLRDTGDTACL